MNVEFLGLICLCLFYIIIQDKVAILHRLGRFGEYYQSIWAWIRDAMFRIIRDENDWEGAWVTHSLIMLNVAAFAYAVSAGYSDIMKDFAFIPALSFEAWRWITYQFLHAKFPVELLPFFSTHLLFNMLFLYVFGDNVEKWLERFKVVKLNTQINIYAGFYIIYGVVAAAAQATVFGWDSYVVMVGASGAISGVLGMYLILFPENKIIIAGRETLPASVYLLVWFVSQFVVSDSSVATVAHITGFVSGVVVAYVLSKIWEK